TSGNYPLRGNHWSVEDYWNPRRWRVLAHLRGPGHPELFPPAGPIETWGYEELPSLHDDLPELGHPRPLFKPQPAAPAHPAPAAGGPPRSPRAQESRDPPRPNAQSSERGEVVQPRRSNAFIPARLVLANADSRGAADSTAGPGVRVRVIGRACALVSLNL